MSSRAAPPLVPVSSFVSRILIVQSQADEATRGSSVKLAAELAGRAFALVTTLAIARGLGVGAFGAFAALSGVAAILALAADSGLQPAAQRGLVSGELSLRGLLGAKLLLSLGVALLGGALAPVAPLLAALLAYFVLAGWSELLGVALRARGAPGAEAATILCLRASALALVLLALAAGSGALAVAVALAASVLPALALGAVLLRRHGGSWGPAAAPATLLRAALPLGLNGVLALLSLRLELLALGALRGAAEAGAFAAALRVVEALLLVPSAIAAGAMPALTREALRGGGAVRARTATMAALLAVPAAAGLALLAPGLVALLFGPAFARAALPLRLLALALVPLFLNAVLLHALLAADRPLALPRVTAARVGCAALLALLLVRPLGAGGAALGFLAAELLLLGLASRACVAAGFRVGLARPLATAGGATLPMLAGVALASGHGPLAGVGAGLAIYAATLAGLARFAPALLAGETADVRVA